MYKVFRLCTSGNLLNGTQYISSFQYPRKAANGSYYFQRVTFNGYMSVLNCFTSLCNSYMALIPVVTTTKTTKRTTALLTTTQNQSANFYCYTCDDPVSDSFDCPDRSNYFFAMNCNGFGKAYRSCTVYTINTLPKRVYLIEFLYY